VALSFKVAFSSQAKQAGIIQRLTRSLPDYNWATWPIFLLCLCQQVIVEDVLINYYPEMMSSALEPSLQHRLPRWSLEQRISAMTSARNQKCNGYVTIKYHRFNRWLQDFAAAVSEKPTTTFGPE